MSESLLFILLSSVDGPTGSGNVVVDFREIAAMVPRPNGLKGTTLLLKRSSHQVTVHEVPAIIVAGVQGIVRGIGQEEGIKQARRAAEQRRSSF